MNYLKCDYMLRHGKGRHEAVVTGMIPAGVFVALKDIAVDGFIHISNLGWGYYEFDEKNLTMTSREEMTQVRVGDRVIVRLEEVDLENRRMSFVLESNPRAPSDQGRKGRLAPFFETPVRGSMGASSTRSTLMTMTSTSCSARKAMTTGTIEPVSS